MIRPSPAAASSPASAAQGGPVRRERQVDRLAGRRPDRGQALDEPGQVAPDERLAAGDPELRRAEPDEDAGQPLDLLERQDELARQEREVAPEDLLGHAVDAPEVAAVGDRDPQVVDRPAEPVARAGSVEVDEREGGALHRPMVLATPRSADAVRRPQRGGHWPSRDRRDPARGAHHAAAMVGPTDGASAPRMNGRATPRVPVTGRPRAGPAVPLG